MRAVIQRVLEAELRIDGKIYSKISKGYVVFLGIGVEDNENDLEYILKKTVGLRIFSDSEDKMNLSIKDIDGEILVVSQFTLYADARKGNRPNFTLSAKTEKAIYLYEKYIELLKQEGLSIKTGVFGADMKVGLVNDGPVTILLDSSKII